MAKKKKTITQRVTSLEDREAILYGFMDDLRSYTKKIDERLAQHEDEMRASRELSHALTILQGEALQMIKDLTSRSNGHEGRLTKGGL
jgi:hypothetical protein